MLLRRLAQNLREQNWTAITIEFVLLVLGVFIGSQASNWNESRVEREQIRGHLSEIAADLRRQQSFSEELLASARMRIAAVDYIYQEAFAVQLPGQMQLGTRLWVAPPREPFPPARLGQLMGSVNLVRISVRARHGYESLISSGRLGLLKNRKLALQIQQYFDNFDDLLDTQGNVLRPFRNDGARDQLALGLSVFDQRPASEIVAMAREHADFAAYLRSQREWAILHFNLLKGLDAETGQLLAAIDAELKTP